MLLLISFISGLIAGFFARSLFDRWYKRTKSQRGELTNVEALQIYIAVIVSVVWLFSVFFSLYRDTFVVSPVIHGMMGAIVGALFTQNIFKKRNAK